MRPDRKKEWYKSSSNEKRNRNCGFCKSSDSSDASVPLSASTSYSPRTVASNWNRYADDQDGARPTYPFAGNDQETTCRGVDFSEALNASGTGGRRFRFEDEKEWEEAITTTTDSTKGIGQFQTLDVHNLVLSLSCIPLPQRLNVDTQYFSSQMGAHYDAVAKKNMSKLLAATAHDMQLATKTHHQQPDTVLDARHLQKQVDRGDQWVDPDDDELEALLKRTEITSQKVAGEDRSFRGVSFVPGDSVRDAKETSTVGSNTDSHQKTFGRSDCESLDWLDVSAIL